MKSLPIAALASLSLLLMSEPLHAANKLAATSKPNIILIYSDDHGYADFGAQGVDKNIRTPNLDALARDGVRFTHGYVSAPQCVPSRAGVITGRYQQRFGVEDNTKGPLPLAELTLAERLKPAGYVSCQVGKWHLEQTHESTGKTDKQSKHALKSNYEFFPLNQGFDEYFTGPMNTFVASHDLQGNKLPNAPHMLSDKRFRCVWQTDAAVSFIDRHARDPFFLYLAYFTPHVPLESPEPWFSKTPANLPKERRQALAMIAAMDEGIGKIRAKLREQGNEQNTLIFFIGDNGAPLKEGAWNGSLNLPLVGEKGMLTDGGVRTPFVAAWPGTLPAGKTYEPPVISLDVAATAVALAGQPHDNLDGVNLMPYLLGEKAGNPHQALFWRWRSQAAIRADHWKLIFLGKEERYLFDLNLPDGQSETTNNLIKTFPEVAADLEKQLLTWNATLPPPGLPRDLFNQDQIFYDAHVNLTGVTARKSAHQSAATDANQGWLCRSGSLAVKDGTLHITPDKVGKQRPFIACARLKIPSPASVTISIRTTNGGKAGIAWRLEGQADFLPHQSVAVGLTATSEWQELKAELPAQGQIIHLRVLLPEGPSDVQWIRVSTPKNKSFCEWNFKTP